MPRCVHCSLSLVHPLPGYRVVEATDVMTRILRFWIDPEVISVEDFLCQECFVILQRAFQSSSSESAAVRAYGHQQVDLACGSSILRAKTHKVIINSPEGNLIMSCTPNQQVHRLQKVCLPCWTNEYRTGRRQTQYDQSRRQQVIHEGAVTPHENMEILTTSRQQLDSVSQSATPLRPIPTPPPQPTY